MVSDYDVTRLMPMRCLLRLLRREMLLMRERAMPLIKLIAMAQLIVTSGALRMIWRAAALSADARQRGASAKRR